MSPELRKVPYKGKCPAVHHSAFVAPNATLVGDVDIGAEATVWFGAVLRGDVQPIRVGARSSIQDLAMLHATRRWSPTLIGEDCTVGHSVVLHGCRLGDRVLVGMGSLLLDDAEVGSDTLIGAGSLITQRQRIPSGVLVLGRPAKVVRELTAEERGGLLTSARNYVVHAQEYRAIFNDPKS